MKDKTCLVAFFLCLLRINANSQTNDSTQYKFSANIYENIKKDSNYWRGGVTSSDLSFIGLYKEALVEYDKPRDDKKTISASDSIGFITKYHPVDARKFIIKKAKENQIIIFNEAHFNPRNRVFVFSLLKDLKAVGYKYFAAETFVTDSTFAKNHHPVFSTGFYTLEPQFANLIREAIKLNFSLYPYEDTSGTNAKEREIGEAKNLQSLLKKDPKAKIIVYCGFDHNIEDTLPGWGKAMAGRLKEFTGIDPYTIDQIVLSERSKKDLESPYFRMTHSDKYAVLTDKDDKPLNNKKVDVLLYSPPTKYIFERPGWVFENGKNPYFLSPEAITISFPIIVQAYMETDEIGKAIPIDMIEIKSKDAAPRTAIALYSNESFKIKLISRDGKTQIIKVNNNRS